MIAHVGVYVKDLKKSEAFYSALLEVVGYQVIFQNDYCLALGKEKCPFFEMYKGDQESTSIHIAFDCSSHEMVDAFYDTALKLGATDNGKPGYRDYFPGYYAAYVVDINGYKLEGLCFRP